VRLGSGIERMNDTSPDADPQLEHLLRFLKAHRGFDFTGYKRPSLGRRIRRRMSVLRIAELADYRAYLEAHPDEFEALFNSILIHVTSFFRDEPSWGFLAEEIVPRILRHAGRDAPIEIWSAGCASGQEPFSVAMLLAEAMGIEDYCRRVKVYATDWDEETLAHARRARFPLEQLETLPEMLKQKYFTIDASEATFHGALRRSVIFGRHDLATDLPISRVDLLLCRNTLMYFNAATQARILSRLHFALHDHGYLFLGRAEMLLSHARSFTPVDLRHRVFSKVVDTESDASARPSASSRAR
jgi:two-component system CheB/CheR fusion protein